MAAFAPVGSGPVGVGFVGVGVISDTYIENLKSFPDIEVLILGDILTAWRPAYGFPLGGQYVNAAGTTVQDFQNGTISWKAGLVSGSLGA